MNLFEKLSGTRIYEELLLTFHETEPVRTIKRLSEYGLLKVIHPDIIFDKRLESLLQGVHDTLSWFNLLFLKERPDSGVLYLMALLSGLDDIKREAAFLRLSIPPRMRDAINTGLSKAKDLIRVLPLRDAVEIYNHLCNLSLETLLFVMAVTPDDEKKKEISHFLLKLRQVKPLTRGEDLIRIGIKPGPVYSEIFKTVLEEKLKDKLRTKEEEIEFIRERYKSISLGV
jgi:tRNA nucleotidyltransferase (CCA-adding enzyme)